MTRQHEVDLIKDALVATEKEIFDAAYDKPESVQDESGDRSLENQGEGLEGQHEAPDDDFESEDESDEEEASEEGEEGEEGEEEGEEGEGEEAAAKPPETKPDAKPEARVPSGRLREQTDRADKAEKALQALQAEREGERTSFRGEIEALRQQVQQVVTSVQQGRPQAEAPKPEAPPDIFENPQGFVEWQSRQNNAELAKRDQAISNMRVETSLAIAHAIHKESFEKAFQEVNKLNVQNPEDRAVVQRIYNAPNPGEALVQWHKRNETLRIVGDDPEKYKTTVADELREALKNDPEFRKQVLDDLRAEANGERPSKQQARHVTRLPKSLNGAAGQSSHGRDNTDTSLHDDSDSAIFNSVWR